MRSSFIKTFNENNGFFFFTVSFIFKKDLKERSLNLRIV